MPISRNAFSAGREGHQSDSVTGTTGWPALPSVPELSVD